MSLWDLKIVGGFEGVFDIDFSIIVKNGKLPRNLKDERSIEFKRAVEHDAWFFERSAALKSII